MEKGILQGNSKTWQLASSFEFQMGKKKKKPAHQTIRPVFGNQLTQGSQEDCFLQW